MTKRVLVSAGVGAVLVLTVMGYVFFVNTAGDGDRQPLGNVEGALSLLTPDGKGPASYELCVRVAAPVTGPVSLYAANASSPRINWSQWFSASAVVTGDAQYEMCGGLNFALERGDTFLVNGTWQDGERYLVENRGPEGSGSSNLLEIWLNDQYYELGKECTFLANGVSGYNLACIVR